MNVIEIVLIILGIQVSNFFMLLFGAFIVSKNKININPVKAYKEHKRDEKNQEKEKLKALQLQETLSNIDNYDGTGRGQKEITRYL